MSDQTPPPASAPTPQSMPTSEERTMAMLCHLLGLFTWIIGPLIIWMIKKDQSAFVDDQGKESINFQITLTIAYIAGAILTCVTLFIAYPLVLALWVVELVVIIMACVAANNGQRYRYPFNWRLLR